jgi:2'-5' RNA ligase
MIKLMKEIYVVILPDKKTTQELNKIRNDLLKKHNLKITNHPLHLTLRSTFTVKDYDLFLKELTRYSKRISSFRVVSNNYEIFNKKTLVLKFEKSKTITSIEKDILKLCKKHMVFEKPFKKYEDSLSQSYYNKYRYIYVLERYNPHITLFYNIKKDIDISNINSNFSFVCDSFAIVEKIASDKGTQHIIKDKVILNEC